MLQLQSCQNKQGFRICSSTQSTPFPSKIQSKFNVFEPQSIIISHDKSSGNRLTSDVRLAPAKLLTFQQLLLLTFDDIYFLNFLSFSKFKASLEFNSGPETPNKSLSIISTAVRRSKLPSDGGSTFRKSARPQGPGASDETTPL